MATNKISTHINSALSNNTTSAVPTALHWNNIIADWEGSGLTRRGFCKAYNINYHQFVYNREKLMKQQTTQQSCKPPKLVAVKVMPEKSAVAAVTPLILHCPNGIKVSIPAGADEKTLVMLLACLGVR